MQKKKKKKKHTFSKYFSFNTESLKRSATVAISVADVEEAAAAASHKAANHDDKNEMVQISLAELLRLQELAKQVEELQPKQKKSKSKQ